MNALDLFQIEEMTVIFDERIDPDWRKRHNNARVYVLLRENPLRLTRVCFQKMDYLEDQLSHAKVLKENNASF